MFILIIYEIYFRNPLLMYGFNLYFLTSFINDFSGIFYTIQRTNWTLVQLEEWQIVQPRAPYGNKDLTLLLVLLTYLGYTTSIRLYCTVYLGQALRGKEKPSGIAVGPNIS